MVNKQEAKMVQGIGAVALLCLHLFNRVDNLPYTALLWIGERPLTYYIGILGDICIPVFSFSAGYAQYLLWKNDKKEYGRARFKRIFGILRHFWLIVILFATIGLCLPTCSEFPGSPLTLLANLSLLSNSMNGAWWYLLTYILLVILFPLLGSASEKLNGLLTIVFSGLLYAVGYFFEFMHPVTVGIVPVDWLINQIELLFRCLLPFMVGTVYCKYDVTEKIKQMLTNRVLKGFLLTVIPIVLMIGHCVVTSLAVAPVVAVGCLTCFYVWEKPRWFSVLYTFLGNHSTDIWLVHMFFYSKPFKNFVFLAKYPLAIFLFMLTLCIAVSYLLKYVEKGITWTFSRLFKVREAH